MDIPPCSRRIAERSFARHPFCEKDIFMPRLFVGVTYLAPDEPDILPA
jgi:hypothetical protein